MKIRIWNRNLQTKITVFLCAHTLLLVHRSVVLKIFLSEILLKTCAGFSEHTHISSKIFSIFLNFFEIFPSYFSDINIFSNIFIM